jgi:inhibitor of KinA
MLSEKGRNPLSIYAVSEQAVTISFGNRIDVLLLKTIKSFDQNLCSAPFPGLISTVVAYATLTIHYDITVVFASLLPGKSCFEKVSAYLNGIQYLEESSIHDQQKMISVPVCYGGHYGPDLSLLSRDKKITESSLIELHSSEIYTVFMIGFIPGFPYLGGMNSLLSAPRKLKPSAAVHAGSVGIAGQQTGIYPLTTPGGWQIIGRTPLILFDPHRPIPSLLRAGDHLKFYPITVDEFINFRQS